MSEFFKKAVKKLGKLTADQQHDLLNKSVDEMCRLETVLDSLPDGVIVLNENHCPITANKFARRLFSLDHPAMEKVPIWMVIHDDRMMGFFETALLSGDKVLDWEIEMDDSHGQLRLLSISMLPLVNNHRITGSLIYIEDITEKRMKEAQLRRAENLASLTTLAAGLAHEIKNPLGSISIHLQLMQKTLAKANALADAKVDGANPDGDNAHLDKYINVLTEEVDRLNHIVVDFLFAVRPMVLNLLKGNINKLVKELCDFISVELEANNIKCIMKLDETIPDILFDERYMKQVLLNLFKNAQSAMPHGGELTVKTGTEENAVWISICDTGVGISQENLSKIFEPYFTTRENGTGLGLTTVYKIIKEHQGDVAVQSKEGKGTCFVITLPVIQKDPKLLEWSPQRQET